MKTPSRLILPLLSLLVVSAAAQLPTLAVIDLEGIGVSQSEALALSNRLRNELFRLGTFKVVERGLMEDILREQDFQQTGCTSNECLVEMGKILGVEQMIGGTISRVGTIFSVSARLIAVETGEVLNVSDYDLRGGLEEMLTEGMQQVALVLSSQQAGPAAASGSPPAVISLSEPEPEQVRPTQPPASPPPRTTIPSSRLWQSRGNQAWERASDYGYAHVSLSRGLQRTLSIRSRPIRPLVTAGFTSRRREKTDSLQTYEWLWYLALAARTSWNLGDENRSLSLYLGPGFGWREYDSYESDRRGGTSVFIAGAQLCWRFRKFPALVIDGSVFSTPDFGRSTVLSFGLQGGFLSGALPGLISLGVLASVYDFTPNE